MTKPADSDQIARAEKMWREMSTAECLEIGMYEFAVKFAASERQAVIEECAKLCCEICANGGDRPVKRENDWTHLGVMPGEYVFCGANEINELRSME